ncbi:MULTISPECIES: proteasome subunit beta [Pseudomonas]|uniref:ATP-dependent protease HslVU (ClpYQ), peptidase subunit n=1 Tax=Pseudomonas japonica TaxID=256466 RepID=A0A239BQT7_9PSED|nr:MULTISPECIES: proteasome subunit beta [Pseudomonas]MDU9394549.1 proteasome subunit beta [Pseudomonas sp. zfem002]SNS10216.1 ATP-dependent protease HslVU (ClpYQ), peptidase subunit [Pseudomonas japonica]
MTTIAYKDGIIAYDSQITRGDVITYDDYEKCLERDGVKFICSGAVPDFARLVDAYFGGTPEGSIDVTAMVLDGEQLMMVAVDDNTGLWKSPIMLDRPYAIGSGTPYAFAAMDMGASAEKAVEMAAKRDTSTGGKIRTLRVASAQ